MEYELKFAVSNHRLAPIVEFMNMVCQPDPLFASGIVSSIYFDSRSWDSVSEKINSDYLKTKYRLRWYRKTWTGEMSATSFAESKRRIGCRRIKKRYVAPIDPEKLETMELDDNELLSIPHFMSQQGIGRRGDLYPSLLVRYKRHRYVEPVTGARVSIDADISAPRLNRFMMPAGSPATLANAVIEVKGGRDLLPPVLRPLIGLGIRKVSFSKYLACYAKCRGITFDLK